MNLPNCLQTVQTQPSQPRAIGLCMLVFAGFFLGCDSNTSSVGTVSDAKPSRTSTQESPEILEEKQISIRVETMMCVDGCFQGIKKVLEKRPNIRSVALAPQKKEGTIDNSTIIVTYQGEFDRQEIERLILGAGFDRIEFQDPAF